MTAKLLLVDDEKSIVENLKESLLPFHELFSTDICFSVDEAIKLYKTTNYDLIISDIRMPKKSGVDLFEYLRKKKYKGGFMAMTGYGNEKIIEKIKNLGSLEIFLKPFDLSVFRAKILDFFSDKEGVSGAIEAIDLTSLLQLINLEKKTLSVKIESKNSSGLLYFENGEIIHAQYQEQEGEEAAYLLIKLNQGRFSLLKESKKVKRTIEAPFTILLMNIMKRIDEDKKGLELNNNNIQDVDKEEKVNVKKLKQSMEVLTDTLGDALLASDIFSANDLLSIVSIGDEAHPAGNILGSTTEIDNALKESKFPGLGKYYLLKLKTNKIAIVIPLGDYLWGLFIDMEKTQLGLVLNIALPSAIDAFEDALVV